MNGLMVVLTRAAYGVLMLMATVFGWHRANFDCKWRVPAHQPGADGVVSGAVFERPVCRDAGVLRRASRSLAKACAGVAP